MESRLKIEAIKAIRSRCSVGLFEAKNAVEAYASVHSTIVFAEMIDTIVADMPPIPLSLKATALAFLNVATFPAWAGDDCRYCNGVSNQHSTDCEYAKAEAALRAAIDRA